MMSALVPETGSQRSAARQSQGCARRLGARTALLALALVVSGCATLIQETEHGRWVEIGPETALILHEPVTIPAGRTRAYIKNGRVSRSGANYRAACAFEVRALTPDRPQSITPGRFKITRAQHHWTEVAAALQDWGVYWQLAELSDGGGQPMIQTGYRFWLERADAPGVMHLTCLGILAEPADAYPPTAGELRRTLGEIATLALGTGALD
jgi:hypothetical protein